MWPTMTHCYQKFKSCPRYYKPRNRKGFAAFCLIGEYPPSSYLKVISATTGSVPVAPCFSSTPAIWFPATDGTLIHDRRAGDGIARAGLHSRCSVSVPGSASGSVVCARCGCSCPTDSTSPEEPSAASRCRTCAGANGIRQAVLQTSVRRAAGTTGRVNLVFGCGCPDRQYTHAGTHHATSRTLSSRQNPAPSADRQPARPSGDIVVNRHS